MLRNPIFGDFSGGGGGRTDSLPPPPLESAHELSPKSESPCKPTKLTSQHSVLGHHRPASETPFEWRFAGGPLMAC